MLVRVHYSLISVGTEIAPLRTVAQLRAGQHVRSSAAIEYAGLARHYLRASIRDPRKAMNRVAKIAQAAVWRALRPAPVTRVTPAVAVGGLTWTQASPSASFTTDGRGITLVTDDTPAGYQIVSQVISVPADHVPVVRVEGRVDDGAIAIGLLNDARDAGSARGRTRRDRSRTRSSSIRRGPRRSDGRRDDRRIAGTVARDVVQGRRRHGAAGRSAGLPLNELDTQGWHVGYSAAGEVVAVGEGIDDLAPGDLVACAGAGQANHADYISVKRNLVCRVPAGCPVNLAASTTVGAIAMQGVRRAAPQLGERVAVLGLGLIGQITAQLLRAAGCDVIGLDLDPARVERARSLGMAYGASDAESFKALVRDATGGRGADRTLITAATKSNAVINLAMDVTRAKGTVVIVGDVGLKVEREVFYRKEIDLLMSTSYGPGRYDAAYEVEGHDYPFALRSVDAEPEHAVVSRPDRAAAASTSQPLIDRVISVDEAPAAYRALAKATTRFRSAC